MTETGKEAIRKAVRGARKAKRTRSEPRGDWRDRLAREDRGAPPGTLANLATALREAPELSGAFAYDQMLDTVVVTRDLPDSKDTAETPYPRPLCDIDISTAQEWLQRHGIPQAAREVLRQAIDLVAQERAFHPVREYLTSLKWDMIPRLGKWLSYYLGVEASPYTIEIGKRFLISMVARALVPGCKADYTLILEGPQGIGKSAACAILGGEWFSDSLPDLILGKEVSQHLTGKWLVEIAELSATNRATAEVLKSFLARRVERYRPPYAREERASPRQCVFVGTTNHDHYLRDDTGARRFWPVRCGRIDLEALRADRDQLFAEAVVAFQRNEQWWPDADFEREHIATEQAKRHEEDPWEGPIVAHLAARQAREKITIPDLARAVLDLSTGRLDGAASNRIAAILRREGWVSKRSKAQRWWQRGEGS